MNKQALWGLAGAGACPLPALLPAFRQPEAELRELGIFLSIH